MHPSCCQFLTIERFPSLFRITVCLCPLIGSCWESCGRAPCQPAGWWKSLLRCVAMAKKWREFPSTALTGCWHFLCACHWQEVLFWVNTAIDSRRQAGGQIFVLFEARRCQVCDPAKWIFFDICYRSILGRSASFCCLALPILVLVSPKRQETARGRLIQNPKWL